ncbi:putative neprosin [Arabidopsis thaliana]|uniref:Neprosin n=1 Tax=Arabidopsis thaliana x Arabidopsis arenosa TaxID=1240361 RepID=A0A8T2FM07_9BRAS|nr:Neprosin [Arabidopsis thaliana x Arabidopsis arenosa]
MMIARFVLSILIVAAIVSGSEFSDTRDAKVEKILKKLNKPALKSIKSPDGDIIDCVHMNNHPIYDHPLFKNYTIQMKPSSYPKGKNNESSDREKKQSVVTQLWTVNGECPKNSIPIRRTRRKEILRTEYMQRYDKKNPNIINHPKASTSNSIHEYAQIQAKGKFHGAHADINVWKPFVQTPKEFSLAQMWVMAGPFSEVNSVEAGWQVYQDRYGDDNPRYFIFWTADGYHSGCYNLDCQGFVPVSHKFALGAAVSNVSTFDGQQYHISTTIWKDPNSGNWWLKFGDEFVGYWPSILFNHLKDGATEIQWGGEIINFKDGALHTTTRMGSGHFAEAGYQKASYFKDLEIIDERDIHSSPKEGYSYMTQESCYNIRSGYAKVWGVYFYYGGPGRNQNCQ